jgi:hypothetical protein
MADHKNVRPHLYLGRTGKTESYTSPSSRGPSSPLVPSRNRQQHGATLLNQLNAVRMRQTELAAEAEQYELESRIGIQIEFENIPGVELAVESLADARQGIELLTVRRADARIYATVFVPEGKLTAIDTKIQAYLNYKTDRNGNARDNRPLIDAIQTFRVAALEALWTDEPGQWPIDAHEIFWWEIWLPVRDNRQAVIHDFRLLAEHLQIQVSDSVLEFPERSILLAKGSTLQFSGSGLLLNTISELRRAKETAAFFDELAPGEHADWASDLLRRLHGPDEGGPVVCVLDTGVNNGHPLIAPFLAETDQFSVDGTWTSTDDEGHGTGMAGLAVWGDLTDALDGSARVRVTHRLESVKILRHPGDNEDKHHGTLTANAVALAEIDHPYRNRVFAMALSTTDGRDRGKPSAWSSALDSLAADALGENAAPRLFTIAAGNAGRDLMALAEYPDHNLLQDIHDPGQAWNALTVGAYTDKTLIAEAGCSDYQPLAPAGGLSPYSTTSVTWNRSTPFKPELVFEGGNVGIDGIGCAGIPSLKLCTTHHQPNDRLFTTFEATSAATALASRFAAEIRAKYPELWPETVRALMVHCAEWTEAMEQQFPRDNGRRTSAEHRIRCVGFGVPNLERALWSAGNSLALIVEDSLKPFDKLDGEIVTRDMHLHDLPWPRAALQDLGEVQVELVVTLSYFIEPNPSSRNISGKYSYASHQLRFDVKRPLESLNAFRKRINRKARDLEEGTTSTEGDPDWMLGSQFRHRGSIHKDIWRGKAAELAERGQIVVYPAMGWWRTRTKLGRYEKEARYALVVSINVPTTDVDIYNAVASQIQIPQTV